MRPALVLAYHGLGTFPKTLDPHNLMLDPARFRRQVLTLMRRPVNFFAYPKCGYSPSCPDAARRAGYLAAVTCAGLGGWRRFELTRVSIDSLDRRLSFALKSRGLFAPLRNSPPGKLARALARPLRHHGAD